MSVVEEMEPEKLNYYWDVYALEVGSKYGLKRGVHAEKGSKVKHTNSTEYNRALEMENRRIQKENAELTRKNGKLREESNELEKRIDSENKTLEIRAAGPRSSNSAKKSAPALSASTESKAR